MQRHNTASHLCREEDHPNNSQNKLYHKQPRTVDNSSPMQKQGTMHVQPTLKNQGSKNQHKGKDIPSAPKHQLSLHAATYNPKAQPYRDVGANNESCREEKDTANRTSQNK
jgi:hypothetical protein